MAEPVQNNTRAICNYEGTSYRASFWDGHGREYEDLAERAALRRLLPRRGHRLVEVGAGYGRLADLYGEYDQIILLDYARSGLLEAQARLALAPPGKGRFIYVAADIYRLPLAPESCDTVVTVRMLHHLVDVPAALEALAAALRPGGAYILEYANKRNLKAILRYAFRRQRWSPFDDQPIEFAELNFDFHPVWMERQLAEAGFSIETCLAVSHFRHPLFKRYFSARALAAVDARLQRAGAAWKVTPSLFARALRSPFRQSTEAQSDVIFCCPSCRSTLLRETSGGLDCSACGAVWAVSEGIYDFRAPVNKSQNETRKW